MDDVDGEKFAHSRLKIQFHINRTVHEHPFIAFAFHLALLLEPDMGAVGLRVLLAQLRVLLPDGYSECSDLRFEVAFKDLVVSDPSRWRNNVRLQSCFMSLCLCVYTVGI